MNALNQSLINLKEANAWAQKARALLENLPSAEIIHTNAVERASNALLSASRDLGESISIIDRRARKQAESWECLPILECVMRYGEKTRKIVCGKPNATIDEPFVMETLFNAICARWGADKKAVTTDEDYEIAIVSRVDGIIGHIPRTCQETK